MQAIWLITAIMLIWVDLCSYRNIISKSEAMATFSFPIYPGHLSLTDLSITYLWYVLPKHSMFTGLKCPAQGYTTHIPNTY